jgi:hypothetical protein
MSDAAAKIVDGSVWKTFCRDLEAAGDIILSAGNWIDTCGHSQGTMLWRWTGAASHPIPQTRVIKI